MIHQLLLDLLSIAEKPSAAVVVSFASVLVAFGAIVSTFIGVRWTNKTNERNQRRGNRANRQLQADRLAAEVTAKTRAERIKAGEDLFNVLNTLLNLMNHELYTHDRGVWQIKLPHNVKRVPDNAKPDQLPSECLLPFTGESDKGASCCLVNYSVGQLRIKQSTS